MRECIILAGGFGTRLQSVVSDVPKCMAKVAGKPFLEYLFRYLENQKVDHVILSLGYMADLVVDWLENVRASYNFKISYVIEKKPLGTGGAIKLAFEKVSAQNAFVINGDTFFDVNMASLTEVFEQSQADILIALKPLSDFDRYGSVQLDDSMRIVQFEEKKYIKEGLINGGVYLISGNIFSKLSLPDNFSFEKDIMEAHLKDLYIYGSIQDNYFIDIGIPSDFEKANNDFKHGK